MPCSFISTIPNFLVSGGRAHMGNPSHYSQLPGVWGTSTHGQSIPLFPTSWCLGDEHTWAIHPTIPNFLVSGGRAHMGNPSHYSQLPGVWGTSTHGQSIPLFPTSWCLGDEHTWAIHPTIPNFLVSGGRAHMGNPSHYSQLPGVWGTSTHGQSIPLFPTSWCHTWAIHPTIPNFLVSGGQAHMGNPSHCSQLPGVWGTSTHGQSIPLFPTSWCLGDEHTWAIHPTIPNFLVSGGQAHMGNPSHYSQLPGVWGTSTHGQSIPLFPTSWCLRDEHTWAIHPTIPNFLVSEGRAHMGNPSHYSQLPGVFGTSTHGQLRLCTTGFSFAGYLKDPCYN